MLQEKFVRELANHFEETYRDTLEALRARSGVFTQPDKEFLKACGVAE